MRTAVWIHKTHSFKDANDFDVRYYLAMSRRRRLETMQFLRDLTLTLRHDRFHGRGRKRLRRVITVLQ